MNSNELIETPDIETSSLDYARRFSGTVGAWFLKIQETATLKMLTNLPNMTILDVGGGHGQLTEPLIRQGYKMTVFGSSESCKERIQKYLDQNLCSFKAGNILKLPYPDQAFDIVVSYRLLPHVSQWPKLINELCRVAKKIVLVDYPSFRSINAIAPLLFRFKKHLEGNTRPFTSFWEHQLLEPFQSNGFDRQAKFSEFFLPMVFHRAFKSPAFSSCLERLFRLIGLTSLLGSPVILKFVRKESSPS